MIKSAEFAERMKNLPEYPFAALGRRLQRLRTSGMDVIRLDMGSPDLPPAPTVIEALAQSAARADTHGYAGYRGTAEFRQAVAEYYERRFDVMLDPETEVLPLIGSKEGLVNLTLAVVGPGDVVLVPSMAYPAYAMGARLAEADVVEMRINHDNCYLPDLRDIPDGDLDRAKMLWLNYPNNPTGAFCDIDYYTHVVEFCRQHEILLCSDNAYAEVVFDGNPHAPSALQAPGAKDVAVEFMSMSKSFNMAGWRLGAAVGNAEMIEALLRVKSNIDSGHFKAIYDAGIVALRTTPQAWIDARNAHYAARRDKLLEILPRIGLAVDDIPRGSLYIWAHVLNMSDTEFTERTLTETGVSITPGTVYGIDGAGFVRISLGINDERLDEAIERLLGLWA